MATTREKFDVAYRAVRLSGTRGAAGVYVAAKAVLGSRAGLTPPVAEHDSLWFLLQKAHRNLFVAHTLRRDWDFRMAEHGLVCSDWRYGPDWDKGLHLLTSSENRVRDAMVSIWYLAHRRDHPRAADLWERKMQQSDWTADRRAVVMKLTAASHAARRASAQGGVL